MPKHELVFFSKRSTGQVVAKGKAAKPKAGYGKQTSRREATEAEEKAISKKRWVRTREDGKAPPDPGAKKSKYRPKQAAKQRAGDKRRAAVKVATKKTAIRKRQAK